MSACDWSSMHCLLLFSARSRRSGLAIAPQAPAWLGGGASFTKTTPVRFLTVSLPMPSSISAFAAGRARGPVGEHLFFLEPRVPGERTRRSPTRILLLSPVDIADSGAVSPAQQ